MNGILFKDFNLLAFDFLKFDWCEMLKSYINFSFKILSLKQWKIEDGLNETCIMSNSVCFIT